MESRKENMAKLPNRCYIRSFYLLNFLLAGLHSNAQNIPVNEYGLRVISRKENYIETIKQHPEKEMVDLKKISRKLVLDLRYTTRHNFMNTAVYPPQKTTYLRRPAAVKLAAAQEELNLQGKGLMIFDAYRPYAVTKKMWEVVKDDRYAADPKTGSGHNRGTAVDVTIIDLKTKHPLSMGTGFDNFSDTAHHSFTLLPKDVMDNRLLLKTIMEKHGFEALETEWWHYALPAANNYELLDLDFSDLKEY